MKNKKKKVFILIVLGIYLLTSFLQSGFYVGNRVYAANTGNNEAQLDYTNIVAIIVNDKIYSNNKVKQDIEWYATEYIQGKRNNKYASISNSRALVFPIDVDNFSTKNIAQLLENIYFDGIKGEPSKLVGLILIGDIPLPVVNQDGYIYPTIYPYVDFEEQKFIWDDESKYFVYNNNPKGQAEIWHGMINFGNDIREYVEYFSKLKNYFSNPEGFIGKAIRYEDFIGNNKYFNDNSLNFYLNNFIFSEDLGYHRYSDLLVKVLQGQRNSEIQDIMEQLNEVNPGVDLGSGAEDLAELDDNMNTPTMQIKSLLDNGYLSTYSSLFGQKYLKTITNNIETANRWIESRTGSDGNPFYLNAFDSVYKKAEITDEVLLRKDGGLEPFLIMINNALEDAVDQKVEEEKYRLDEVLPLTYLKYEGRKRFLGKCVWQIYDAFENYFFGTNAKYVQTMEETSTYRGTFRNYLGIDGLTISGIQNSQNPATDVSNLDLNKKSIGGSYEIFATQVDANRGYNYNNSLEEYDIYNENKTAIMDNWDVTCVKRFLGICIKRRWSIVTTDGSGCDLTSEDGDQGGCENPMEYALRVWGGASPLNLDMDGINFLRKSGYSYTGATSSIFDIAGSTSLPLNTPEYESNSYQSVNKYSNLTLRRFSPDTEDWPKFKSGNPLKKKPDSYGIGYDYSMDYEVKFTNRVPEFDGRHVSGWSKKEPLTAGDVDYFRKYDSSAEKQGNVIKITKILPGGDESCQGAGEIYTYKTLDSRVKNDSVNADEVNGKVYKIFKDDSSHVKQFYMELFNYLDAISGSVSAAVGSETGSLNNKLQFIKAEINDINSGFKSIMDFDLDDLNAMNTGAILSKSRDWINTFDDTKATNLLSAITGAQDDVLNLKGLVDFGDTLFDGVIDFVDEQKKIFQINGWNLIFLVTRKHNINQTIAEILDNYKKIKTTVSEAGIIYGTINELGKEDFLGQQIPDFGFSLLEDLLSLNVVENLSGKKERLGNLLNGSGCETKYRKLCEALDVVIDNYNEYVDTINEEKQGINKLKIQKFDDDGNIMTGQFDTIDDIFKDLFFNTIFTRIDNSEILDSVYTGIGTIPQTMNEELTGIIPGMNMTTSDRPIDSPRYLTFKGIGGDKVTFIYPDIYKSEIFLGDSNVLSLKTTGEIENAIKSYLRGVVASYNKYLRIQSQKNTGYYNVNSAAYNTLETIDSLANPNHKGDDIRPYNLFSGDYLIDWLENVIRTSPYFSGEELAQSNPIGFIASMIYLQNITWQTKTLSGTIQGDFDNQRMDFDINEKVSYLMDNYLIADNYQGNYLTPDYRTSGYEVAFINSDGNDRILYENTPDIVNTMNSASTNYTAPRTTNTELMPLEEELLTECNIPIDEGVLLFQVSNGRVETPWFDALACRLEKIKEKPFELKITFPFIWNSGASLADNLGEVFNWDEYQNIGNTYQSYINQWSLLDMTDVNESVLEGIEISDPSAMASLQEILSYTLITPNKTTISADNPVGEISIESSKQLGSVEFNIVNVGGTKIKLFDGDSVISNNITVGTGGFSTGRIIFDPYNQKTLNFRIDNPVAGLNVVVFNLCLPGTQRCVKRSFRLDVVPGEVKNVDIELDKHLVLEGASVPFEVKGTDAFGNKIGELVSQMFETSVTSGYLSLNGAQGQSIKISNFDKTKFSLFAISGELDGKTINIQVSGFINGEPGIKAIESVNVVKGRLDTYSGNIRLTSGNVIITGLEIKLPDNDIYFINGQPNTGTLPRLTFRLVNKNGNLINIDGKVSVKTKNNLLSPGNIVSKEGGDGSIQYSFNKTKTFYLSGGICTVYLLPSFSAGEDVFYVSMEGVDSIELPIVVKHGSAKVLSLSADNTALSPNSYTNANLKVFDNWSNIVDDENVSVSLGLVNNKVYLSRSGNIVVRSGSYDFEIHSTDKGGLGYVYSYIRTVPMNQQSPDVLNITIQEKMLPEKDLNVMYLNLFGNDWGNQWGYMSDNKKYSESLINNSDRLITITTQLLGLENIKYYPVVIDSGLQINNMIGNDINFSLRSGFLFDIDQIGTISVNSNSFILVEVSGDNLDTNIASMMAGTYGNKNVILYAPEQPDSIIRSNGVLDRAIYINGHKVFDARLNTFDKNLTISLGYEKYAGYQAWQVFYDETFVGNLLFAVNRKDTISMNLYSKFPNYSVGSTWINGSSNEYGLGFYEIDSSLPTKTLGYKSIQDSYDSMLGIGFTADFKNITNFGGGMPVGEATLPFGSELLINIGDPLLKRIDGNESAKIYDGSGNIERDTEFDLGLGEVIYSDPDKEILKVINIDFNNDNLEDIIVVYKDGTIKILKNYGGTNPFQNLGALMTLADRISGVSVGDVDGNGYEDILIWTAVGGLRVYLNNKGIFDVDGYPVCLNVDVERGEISEHPEKVSGIHQIFLKDMDLDGALDIVTNDSLGFVKIFYGGSNNGVINYVSTNKYMCDENWYNRVQNNSKIIYRFGVKIDSSLHVLDQSLIRWKGIDGVGSGEISGDDIGVSEFSADDISLDTIGDLLGNITNFDVSGAEGVYLQKERFRQAGFGIIPVYESGIDSEGDINYVEIGALTGSDPVKIYKTYEDMNHNPIESNLVDTTGSLIDGDLVRVSVYMVANQDFTGTFVDKILGPWIIPLSENDEDAFENFRFDSSYIRNGHITSGQIDNIIGNIHWDLGNARYMLDNISMKRGDRLKFSYGLLYSEYRVFDIDVDVLSGSDFSGMVFPTENLNSFSHDVYPDILIQPTDGCNDSMFVFFNNGSGSRDYSQKFMNLEALMADYNENSQANADSAVNNVMQGLGDSVSNGDSQQVFDSISDLAGGLMESIDWKGMLSLQGLDLTNLANAGTQFVDALPLTNKLVKKIDDAIGSACNGISLGSLNLKKGGSCGLPVPFNQAFLGAGNYHVFGCYNIDFLNNLIGNGMPVLNIPGNYAWMYSPASYIPAPGFFGYPFKGGSDGFSLGNDGGTNPSLFRVYVMPTLTMGVGFAMCFGLYTVGAKLKDPWGSIAGNCIVFAVTPPCFGGSSDGDQGGNTTTDIPYQYSLLKSCNKQNNPLYLMPGESSTPFVLGGSSPNSYTFHSVIPYGTYAGGLINMEVAPETRVSYTEEGPIDIDELVLRGGTSTQNAIRGSTEQGLIQRIVKQWLDKQIKYIMTNLTNRKVSIIWPDLESLLGKNPPRSLQEMGKEYCDSIKGERVDGDAAKDRCNGKSSCCKDTEESQRIKCEDRGRQWDSQSKQCVKKISPNFDDESLNSIDSWTQQNLLSREQIASRSDYNNPFKELEEAFNETPLINISTQDIAVNIPMLTSEDITSYISMSQNWVNRQKEILEEWQDFFKSIIGVCGGSTNINGISDLKVAIDELKEQYKDMDQASQTEEDDKITEKLQGKIDALEKLKNTYNLSDLGEYKIYESKSGGFYVYNKFTDVNSITPYDVYLYFDPGTLNLSMFTAGFDLIVDNSSGKTKISIKRNKEKYSNDGLNINKDNQSVYYSCAEIFLDGTMDQALKGFLNIQSSADTFMFSVKQNIETLQQYKLFPLQLYDWIHVMERYLGDVSNLVNSVLGTLSIWMETNANRYSQYVDAIITVMTTLETYQLIIDLSADWTEKCSTCTNDNYDQFSCKLGKICDMLDIDLPVVEIPSTKIPSIYLDFSEIHVSMGIKFPNFVFNSVAVPLPELPNLPTPPKIDLSVNLDEALGAGLQALMKEMKLAGFDQLASVNLGSIPLLPSPPTLPELPSFIPEVQMELPLLPPAPKIPELPDSIKASIQSAKIVSKILCIVKGKFGLVGEKSIKAKVEQITQRTYEVPFFDNFDLTLSDWNASTAAELPSSLARVFTGFSALLGSNQFKDVKMQGFDIYLQTYINLQLNFDYFYSFLEGVVSNINEVSYIITDFVGNNVNNLSEISKKYTDKMKACVNNPISVECNPDAAEQIQKHKELTQKIERYKKLLEDGFVGLGGVLDRIEENANKIEELQKKKAELIEELNKNNILLDEYNNKLNSTNNSVDRNIILDKIEYTQNLINKIQTQIDEYNSEIEQLDLEIRNLRAEYGTMIDRYNEIKNLVEQSSAELAALYDELLRQSQEVMDRINEEMDAAGEAVDFDKLNLLDIKLRSGQNETSTKTEQEKQRRYENLQDLYKNIDGAVSYVDYDSKVNEKNISILKETLSEISRETNNRDIKNRAEENLSLITMNKEIDANVDAINDVGRKYNAMVTDYKTNTDNLSSLIKDDYDEFLVAIADNNTSLVSDKSFDVTLSANLFDMDKDAAKLLSNQDGRITKYMDYNMNNLQGYLNALENNSAETLNMSDEEYNLSKTYLERVKAASDTVYGIINGEGNDNLVVNGVNNPILLAQSVGGGGGVGGSSSASSNTVDIANYIEGRFINTEEGIFLLANEDYVKNFQSRFLLTDINMDNRSDLILWDKHNVYIKYRKDNSVYENTGYNTSYYVHNINSYDELVSQARDGYVKIKNVYVKLVDQNWEVKNFKYVGETFDSIKVSWLNNTSLGDDIDGYLVKMIHRVDQFNNKESLISQGNNRELFDKKYILVLPKGSDVVGTSLELENGNGVLSNIEELIGTGKQIFGLSYYNESDKTINLMITDIPRNWQYSEIYTLNFEGNTYKISSSASNQVVAGPQIIADSEGPTPDIRLYRPATDTGVSEGTLLEGYVGTNYILQIDWEDNIAMDEMWIYDDFGEVLAVKENVYSKTGYIELTGLYFTGEQSLDYYILGVDIQGNKYSTDVNLNIKKPAIQIKNILKGVQNLNYLNGIVGYTPGNNFGGLSTFGTGELIVTVEAELEHDIDSGFVQFIRNRNSDKWELLTGIVGSNMSNMSISSFQVAPGMTDVYGGNFSMGDDIGLYSTTGNLVATINPNNGKITLTPGYPSNIIDLDYLARIPIIKVMEGDKVIFWIVFPSQEFVGLDIYSNDISVETLDNEGFGDFNGGKAVLKNGEVLLYVSPKGQIYVDVPFLYGDYSFDEATQSVKYSFRTDWEMPDEGAVKIKIRNLFE